MKRKTHADSAPPPTKRRKVGSSSSASSTPTNSTTNDLSFSRRSSVSLLDSTPHRFSPGDIVHEDDHFIFQFLYNDEVDAHLIALCDLKQIFAACLPRMGTRYVTRHVFDKSHRLLACRAKHPRTATSPSHSLPSNPSLPINFPDAQPIIGGMCIRPFYDEHFGEVVFLAVSNSHQHRSVGRKIMRVMKEVAVRERLSHFYTYADNQAIGFFEKMGFVKKKCDVNTESDTKKGQKGKGKGKRGTKKREPFQDYIKHYTGSELMASKLYAKMDYLRLDANLADIERDILRQCEMYRKAHFGERMKVVYAAPNVFVIPILRLCDVLEFEEVFVGENGYGDDLLCAALSAEGIENDRDLYAQRERMGQILSVRFGERLGAAVTKRLSAYLESPSDKQILHKLECPRMDQIEGVEAEWIDQKMNGEKGSNGNAKNNRRERVFDSHSERESENQKRRSTRFAPVRVKANWMLKRVRKHDDADVFREPVPRDVPRYYEKIKHPMDLQTMGKTNDRGEYNEWAEVQKDFALMIANCALFNEPGSEIVKMSVRVQEHWTECERKYEQHNNHNQKT